jgi:hypothetical protein
MPSRPAQQPEEIPGNLALQHEYGGTGSHVSAFARQREPE